MKHIIAAIALLAVTVPALAQTQLDPRTQDYRMWSAERMIEHVVVRLGRMNAACKQAETLFPKISETCEKNVMSLYPQLKTIREVAARGDDVEWAKVVDIVRTLEQDTEPHLQAVGK